MSEVAKRLASVRAEIARAAEGAKRDPASVRLVAVSKLHPASAIREAYEAGQRDFGENYAQELVQKAGELSDLPDLRWHMIGHLQSNKARLLAPHIAMIHTIDSAKLAAELGRRIEALGRTLEALVEVNVARDPNKSGCDPADLPSILEAVRAEGALTLRGLMTMPPFTEDPEGARPSFSRLREVRDAAGEGLPELSMGMSHDLRVAIEEGATIVRVGTAIFGERPGR